MKDMQSDSAPSTAPDNASVLALMQQGNTIAAMRMLRGQGVQAAQGALQLNRSLYHAAQGESPEVLEEARLEHMKLLLRSTGPQRVTLLYNLGCLALAQEEVNEACLHFQEAARLDSQHARALHNLGYANELLAEYDHALSAYQQALALAPDQVLTRINLALLRVTTGERESGLLELRDLAEADPSNAGVVLYFCRGLLADGKEDDFAEALAVLERCEDTGMTPELLECRAFAQWRMGHRDQAEESFRTLLMEDPQSAFARLGMMNVLAERGDYGSLLEHAEAYHQMEPSERTQRLLNRLNAL